MGLILELVKECDVRWVELGEVAEIGTGSFNRKDETENGQYPFYVRSKHILKSDNFQFNETAIIIPGEGGIGDIFHYIEGKYALHQRAYRIHILYNNLMPKFLYYFMSSYFKQYILIKSVGATSISIRKPMLENFKIPIPPLDIQSKIVQILDNFTELTAELTAELGLRKKQYEYYRDKLLSFDSNVKWVELGEVGEVRMCKRVLKKQTSDIGDIPFYKIGTFGKKANAFISKELFNELKTKYNYPNFGEILISASGTIGRCVIFNGEDAYFQDSNIVWLQNDESKILNKFLFYVYQSINWNATDGGTIQRLYNENLKKIKIPIPSLETQQKIVNILDKFNTLANSLEQGLPKEIELRVKQYEYYRDKLLDFKKP